MGQGGILVDGRVVRGHGAVLPHPRARDSKHKLRRTESQPNIEAEVTSGGTGKIIIHWDGTG